MRNNRTVWAVIALTSTVGLAGPAAGVASAGSSDQPLHLAQMSQPSDEVLWQTIRETGYVELYEFFLSEFPASRRAAEAKRAIAILKGEIDPEAEAVKARAEAQAATAAPEIPQLDPLNLDVAAFQEALREHGCNAGIADGIWGDRTASAAQRFVDALGLAVDPSRPNVALFGAVFSAEGDVCGEV